LTDREICFDYHGLPSEISRNLFTDRFGEDKKSGLKFDKVLKFVRFPYAVDVLVKGKLASKSRSSGRQDMEFFFEWLYEKGVRQILKVEVHDDPSRPHSDESIAKSLGKFIVEQLHWQKTDLDPKVIHQIGQGREDTQELSMEGNRLQEVRLKWSGSNAVLRGWSEPRGLPYLPRLRLVHLDAPAENEVSALRVISYVPCAVLPDIY
jgi:hypothetical protein